jgi:protein FAM50
MMREYGSSNIISESNKMYLGGGNKRKKEEEEKKKKLEELARPKPALIIPISEKFTMRSATTIEPVQERAGLQTLSDFKKKRKLGKFASDFQQEQSKKRKVAKPQLNKLSFADEEDEDGDDGEDFVVFKIVKDPNVDTSFLPDKERDEREELERERLKNEWLKIQEEKRSEMIMVYFTFTDGPNDLVRHEEIVAGSTVREFLDVAKNVNLDYKLTSPSQLMFIKDMSIIPHDMTFYEIQELNGLKWNINLFPTKEDGSKNHPVEIVERAFYDKNSHCYPMSHWKPYEIEQQ